MIRDENKCEEYLREVGILKRFTSCIKCGSARIAMIRGERFICNACKCEWTRRKDSILTITRFSYSEFLICLKYFALEFSAEQTSKEFDLNYKTVRTLFQLFRMKIGGLNEEDIERFSKIVKQDTETIGLRYIYGKVKFELITSDKDEARIKATRRRVQNSAAYFEFTFKKIKSNLQNGTGKNGYSPLDIFWRFASERLYRYRGVEQKYLILFLKEMEFRYNLRERDVFDGIIQLVNCNQF